MARKTKLASVAHSARARTKKKFSVPSPFQFPKKAHCRRHGPQGHVTYPAYKPWLRDEFEFRCVYCLTREQWSADGHNSFSIDHVQPKSRHRKLTNDYDNLVYACIRCNTLKSTKLGLPDPCQSSLAKHLKLLPDGRFTGQTPEGVRLVQYLMLNSPDRVGDRLFHLYTFQTQNRVRQDMLRLRFGYPPNLPDLSKLKPPKGNQRPKGLEGSYYVRQQLGRLPPYY
jgi:5-methylcytosine-specific restriction endonuclease McrA